MEEHVIGILKVGVYLDQTFANKTHEKRALKNVIKLHNAVRLHLSLVCNTPNMI
jgi:putative transposase